MSALKLPNAIARDLADVDAPWHAESSYDFALEFAPYSVVAVVENRATGESGRWESIHELVIKTVDGRLWRTTYREGLTERQDYGAFEHGPDEIEFTEVRRQTVEAHEWVSTDRPVLVFKPETDAEFAAHFEVWMQNNPRGFESWLMEYIRIRGMRLGGTSFGR